MSQDILTFSGICKVGTDRAVSDKRRIVNYKVVFIPIYRCKLCGSEFAIEDIEVSNIEDIFKCNDSIPNLVSHQCRRNNTKFGIAELVGLTKVQAK